MEMAFPAYSWGRVEDASCMQLQVQGCLPSTWPAWAAASPWPGALQQGQEQGQGQLPEEVGG